MPLRLAVGIGVVLVFLGCSAVGPDYPGIRPRSPEQWRADTEGKVKQVQEMDEALLEEWWQIFDDPVLSRLESEAIRGNLTIKEAVARIKQARALLGVERAGFYPKADASGSYSRQRTSSALGETDSFNIAIDSAWEIDIFGGTRRAVEAAVAELEAEEAGLEDALVSLTAEIALRYIELRTYENRLRVARDNMKIQEETYELNKSRYEAGLVDELTVQQALYNLEQTRSTIPLLQSSIEKTRNGLAVLLGKEPGEIDRILSSEGQIPAPPVEVAVGIPAEVLRRRPDIRQAERRVAAETAKIGVAKAELYPKLRLIGTIGLESLKAGDLFQWASRFWQIGPGVTWRIFDAGEIRQSIKAQTAAQEQAIIQYEATVLAALEEVENALVDFAKEQRRREALIKAVEAARRAERLAQDRYNAGLVDFVTVLDAQRTLRSLEDELVQSTGNVSAYLVKLYKALGGGWSPKHVESLIGENKENNSVSEKAGGHKS
ncbi:efflux transporter outer membrane subunit [Thermodesulforhabdus norvegica]|uniref:Efflux transporter, outer membrane factor (OMF) lipoprotein, NodT family n=1 Tax=Thermodesulforhabdus norvegica TaxID=39841 RepID=A0A1I4QRQ5_9BACT|nr:efflux transporter outer membrane subunit [Thermodesulforhabdus norvegica]SFM42386.1 efflux transporter, outer membrane factor (OMF) lipoprotein, NodT family [Thermodesulforhabdus norvegica]